MLHKNLGKNEKNKKKKNSKLKNFFALYFIKKLGFYKIKRNETFVKL